MKKVLMAGVVAVALAGTGVAYAGNIVLTGHDNDFHFVNGANPGPAGPAGLALGAELGFARAGSTLPILSFDQGTQLTTALTGLAVPFTNVSTIAGVGTAMFDPTLFSAIAVASEVGCGGCDNTPAFIAALATREPAIGAFLDAGRGILGLAGDGDPLAYAYVPASASNPGGSPPDTGYVQTAAGAALGLPPVNGNPTHNFFNEPGSGGLAAAYVVTERLINPMTGTPETVACVGCTTAVLTTPEPGSLALLGSGLLGLAAALRRKRRAAA
jgi:hypothetical protein